MTIVISALPFNIEQVQIFKQIFKMNTTKKFEYNIEFFDREKEKQEILHVLMTEPQLINFIYGPINSGKTTLITNLIKNLPDNYIVFYINLRGKSVVKYGDFIRVLFTIEEKGLLKKIKNIFTWILKHVTSAGEKTLYKYAGIPVDKGLLETFFKEKSNEDVFNYLEEYFKNISKHKTPVLIIDELQVISDLEINGKAIYKLFNFLIRLTKELHICHVFTLSSDSLFIEKVYNEAILKNRCRYLLVDDFDEKTARKFLEKYGFAEEEIKLANEYVGGKPALLTTMIDEKKIGRGIKDYVEKGLADSKEEIAQLLYYIKTIGVTIKYQGKDIDVNYEDTIEILKNFSGKEFYKYSVITPEHCYLVSKNILFVDTREKIIKPQTKFDLLAIRKILKEIDEI